MRDRRVRVAIALVAAAFAASACGSGGGPEATAVGSSSASVSNSASASASSSGAPGSGFSKEATDRASSATKKALLPSSAFAKIGLDVADKPKTGKWDWFETCRPTLPSESRQVVGTNGRWERDGVVVSQTVVAYPDGVAEDLVGEVAKAVTCPKYLANGKTYSKVAPLELAAVKSADAHHAWCVVDEEDVTICHSVLAAQDVLSSLWVSSSDAKDAKDGLATLTDLAAERIVTQIG
jgi:hypothetical protein